MPLLVPDASTLSLLRTRAGLLASDTSKDAEITAAYGVAGSWLERYLDRFLAAGIYTETFTHIAKRVLSLKGYPIVSVTSVADIDGVQPAYHVSKQDGLIHFDGSAVSHELTVVYECAPPATGPLLMALLLAFDVVWAALQAPATNGANPPVKRISQDGASIEFAIDVSGSYGTDAESGLPNSALALLSTYRREYC